MRDAGGVLVGCDRGGVALLQTKGNGTPAAESSRGVVLLHLGDMAGVLSVRLDDVYFYENRGTYCGGSPGGDRVVGHHSDCADCHSGLADLGIASGPGAAHHALPCGADRVDGGGDAVLLVGNVHRGVDGAGGGVFCGCHLGEREINRRNQKAKLTNLWRSWGEEEALVVGLKTRDHARLVSHRAVVVDAIRSNAVKSRDIAGGLVADGVMVR
jgi:hypothetical protein